MENKRKNIYIVIFVITTIIASCAAIYFKLDGDKKITKIETQLKESTLAQNNANSEEENISKEDATTEKIVKDYKLLPELDSTKCINPRGDEKYQLRISYEFPALSCVVNPDNKTAVLTTNWEYVTKLWGFIPNGGNGVYEQKNVDNFSGEIADVIYTGWGQTADCGTLLFLMKDGTLEYIPVYNAYKTNNFKSYGKLEGVSDVVYIGNATGYGPCTPIAMKKDGSFYQLSTILEGTGNYKF